MNHLPYGKPALQMAAKPTMPQCQPLEKSLTKEWRAVQNIQVISPPSPVLANSSQPTGLCPVNTSSTKCGLYHPGLQWLFLWGLL